MKKILFIILFLSFSTCFSAIDDYFDMEYLSTNYTGLCKSNDGTIYTCGWYGCIMMSKNNGRNWKKFNTGTDDFFMAIASYGKTIISVGINGTIVYSNDSGKHWQKSNIQTGEKLNSIILFDSDTGILFGNSGLIMKTSDGGLTWSTATINTTDNIIDAIEIPSGAIFIATITGKIYKSDDLGNNWNEVKIPDIVFSPSNFSYTFDDILYLSSNNYILKSTDKGNTWTAYNNPSEHSNYCSYINEGQGFLFGDMMGLSIVEVNNDSSIVNSNNLSNSISPVTGTSIYQILFVDENNGIAIGNNNFIALTSDKGKSWQVKSYLNGFRNSGFKDLFFFNDSSGIISSDNQNLYKTTNEGVTWNFIKKDSNRKSYISINQIFFLDELKGIMQSENELLTTNDGGLTVTIDNEHPLNGSGSPIFRHVKSDTFCFSGNRWFYNTYHSYFSFRNFEGKWWGTIVIDSALLNAPYTFDWQNIYRCGLYIDSSLMPEKPDIYYRGLIVHSTDGGISWQKIFFDSVYKVDRLKLINDSTLFAYTIIKKNHSDSLIFKTTDYGKTWFKVDTNFVVKIADLKPPNENYSIELEGRTNYFSSNGGKDMEEINITKAFNFGRIFTTQNCFYILGKIGTDYPVVVRYKLKDTLTNINVKSIETMPAPRIWVFDPFPNPAKSYVNFNLIWDKRYSADNIKVKFYNFYGVKIDNPIYEINNTTENSGILKWYPSGVSNGMYILEIELDGYKKVRKFIILN